MKARMSGWSTRMMPMLAPRRNAPCWMASVTPDSILQEGERAVGRPSGRADDRAFGT